MSLIDFIYPKYCLNCKKSGVYVCATCISKVGLATGVCPECKKASIDGFTHSKCLKKQGLDGLLSIWNYEGVVRKGILALKYKYATQIAAELSKFIANKLAEKKFLLREDSIVIPIPLNRLRENYRGFNQSYLLGMLVARIFHWRFAPDLLVRKKASKPQVGLHASERAQNVKGVFSVRNVTDFRTSCLVVFDDVYTTGSTLKEAAKVLKRNGACKVWGLTVAR